MQDGGRVDQGLILGCRWLAISRQRLHLVDERCEFPIGGVWVVRRDLRGGRVQIGE
jgi:hypothetical protein